MRWVLIIGLAWLAISVVTALLLGARIRLAEERRVRPHDARWHAVVEDAVTAPGVGTAEEPIRFARSGDRRPFG